MTDVICPNCDSINTTPFGHVDDLYECLDCDEIFEDDNFTLEEIRKHRLRTQDPE